MSHEVSKELLKRFLTVVELLLKAQHDRQNTTPTPRPSGLKREEDANEQA